MWLQSPLGIREGRKRALIYGPGRQPIRASCCALPNTPPPSHTFQLQQSFTSPPQLFCAHTQLPYTVQLTGHFLVGSRHPKQKHIGRTNAEQKQKSLKLYHSYTQVLCLYPIYNSYVKNHPVKGSNVHFS